MHVLIPFDIVPVSRRVPFGVAPASERAVRYAIDVFGPRGDTEITAIHLTSDEGALPENIGTSEIERMAREQDIPVETDVHVLEQTGSMDAIRAGILDIVDSEDIDAVVMGYEEKSFVEEVFHESTANRILERHDIPVTLVP
jgi:nucleotide-binding universal stress UspA family protein